ncbi:Facilitated trehalose transporter Tret1 [Frankliniella fusca]|uniref:Facilitated trehalose transporter Tret1 n=1 Tax=Frankliniella fusca TaxID=407009 RepID=A0AAE1H872_9NEOP|nr:Facilitated trehalose transporter Tret1 [Frankliniella fusca]
MEKNGHGANGHDPKAAAAALALGSPGHSGPEGGRKLFQFLGAGAACLFAVCMGTTMGWTSAANRLLKSGEITDTEYSLIGAFMPLGALCAALPYRPRRGQVGPQEHDARAQPHPAWMIIVARFIIGAAIGSISMIAPLYSNEIAHKSVRGTLGGFFQFLHTCGVLFAYLLGWAITGPSMTWISVICGCVPLVAGVTFFFFPDTPTWYLQQGRNDEARRSLIKFRGHDYPEDLLQAELDDIINELNAAAANKKTLKQAFTTKEAKLGLGLSMTLMVVQQLSGVSAVVFYAAKIFKSAGSTLSEDLAAIVMGACLAGATLVSLFLVHRYGRRLLLLVSGAACFICNVILGIYLLLLKNNGTEAMEPYGLIPIVTMSLFMVLFSFGYGPIPWTYMTEVFLIDIRGPAVSVATITNWIMVFISTVGFQPLQDAVGIYTTFFIFAAVVFAGSVVVLLFLVETKDKTPQEIQEELRRGRRRLCSGSA